MADQFSPVPESLAKSNVASIVRHALTTGAATLIAGGVMTSGELNGCVTEFIHGISTKAEESGGGAMLAVTLGWSFYKNWKSKQAVQSATQQEKT